MNPMTSAKAWAGGITAALLYEWLNPIVAWLVTLLSGVVERAVGTPMPDAAQNGLAMLIVALAVGAAVHWIPNANPTPTPTPPA